MRSKRNTIVVSDLHLTEIQPIDERRPLWMSYKNKDHIIDGYFADMLEHLELSISGEIELVLNGDTFDFDTILTLPDNREVDWLSKRRGLGSEEWMSLFKMDVIINDHPIWFGAVKNFITSGNRVVFIVGNHDIELYWPSVQQRIYDALNTDEDSVIFCNSFYISEQDTYISHSHQFDPNCVVKDTINPLIQIGSNPMMRLPFGDQATRYVLNGIGWLNPHCHTNYIKSISEYFSLLVKYLRAQPLMVWSWLWGSIATFLLSLRDHLMPSLRDPLLIEEKISNIAERSNATPAMVRRLRALRSPSACANPINVFRELWLDRILLLFGLLFMAWQIMLHINIAISVSMVWFLVPFMALFPILMVYSLSIEPSTSNKCLLTEELAEYIIKITGVKRIIFGHTHLTEQFAVGPAEYFNPGCWAPAFSEPECINKVNDQALVWIKPEGEERTAKLYTWPI